MSDAPPSYRLREAAYGAGMERSALSQWHKTHPDLFPRDGAAAGKWRAYSHRDVARFAIAKALVDFGRTIPTAIEAADGLLDYDWRGGETDLSASFEGAYSHNNVQNYVKQWADHFVYFYPNPDREKVVLHPDSICKEVFSEVDYYNVQGDEMEFGKFCAKHHVGIVMHPGELVWSAHLRAELLKQGHPDAQDRANTFEELAAVRAALQKVRSKQAPSEQSQEDEDD